jgi:antitoxin (DNA-binding transcriptional repressor) of toxin-antitoxin stability system
MFDKNGRNCLNHFRREQEMQPMSTTMVDVQELPTRFAELLSLAAAGNEVIVTDKHIPLARLVPLSPGQTRILGLHAGAITTTPDFDAPLPDDFWVGTP